MSKPYELTYFKGQIKSVLTLPERKIYTVGDTMPGFQQSGKIKGIEEREGSVFICIKYYDLTGGEIKVA